MLYVEIQVLENTMGYWRVMDAQGSLKDLYEDDLYTGKQDYLLNRL